MTKPTKWSFCACGFGVILPLSFFFFFFFFFFFNFLLFFNLIVFSCATMTLVACRCNFLYSLYQTFLNFAGVLSWSEDVHILLCLSFHHFYQHFIHFFVFSGPISIRIDPLWAQLNTSYSFTPIIFKLCILILHGLNMCVWFAGYSPVLLFFFFFFFFLLSLFRVQLELVKMYRYLVGATPPRVSYQSFWSYAYLFFIVWRCACGFGAILLLYGFKAHNPLVTKPWRQGTLVSSGLLFSDSTIYIIISVSLINLSNTWFLDQMNLMTYASFKLNLLSRMPNVDYVVCGQWCQVRRQMGKK